MNTVVPGSIHNAVNDLKFKKAGKKIEKGESIEMTKEFWDSLQDFT